MSADFYNRNLLPRKNATIIIKEMKYLYDDIMKCVSEIETNIIKFTNHTEHLIGLLLKRSQWQIICPLAILKSNCVYMPINVIWPIERIRYVLDQSNAGILILDKEIYEQYGQVLKLTESYIIQEELVIAKRQCIQINSEIDLKELAYIIYTSGTTGFPKGVAISKKSLENFSQAYYNSLRLESNKTILSTADYSFDMFIPEGILAMNWGMTVILAERQDIINPRRIVKLLKIYKPQYMQIVPSSLKLIMFVDPDLHSLKSIEKLIMGAEKLQPKLFSEIKKRFKGNLFNLYGPTETTVWCCMADLTNDNEVNIGYELPGCIINILDENNQGVSNDQVGEICIGGSQVAYKYWNNEDESNKNFYYIGDDKYYRSGDLGYRDEKGKIYCLGRKDKQVKINGYRVELHEIEEVACGYKGVKEAIATLIEEPEEQLILFLLTNCGFQKRVFWEYLRRYLPYYEMPSRIILIDKLYYNYNGKIDRKEIIQKYYKTR